MTTFDNEVPRPLLQATTIQAADTLELVDLVLHRDPKTGLAFAIEEPTGTGFQAIASPYRRAVIDSFTQQDLAAHRNQWKGAVADDRTDQGFADWLVDYLLAKGSNLSEPDPYAGVVETFRDAGPGF